jgi:hypothetical protein
VIPIACPNCGRRGNVPPDKLNSRLHCKKCDAVFHMDASGHVVLGEPGSEKKSSSSRFAMPTAAPEPMELGQNLALAWKGLPMAVRVLLVVVLIGGGALLAGVRMPRFGSNIPPDLGSRADYVADRFIDDDPSAVRRLAAPGTESDVSTWYQKVRPMFKHSGPRKQGNIVLMMRIPIEEDIAGGKGRYVHNLMPPNPEPDPDKTKKETKKLFVPGYRLDGTFDLPTIWKRDNGQWYLDGTATLQAVENPPDVAEPKAKAAAGKTNRRAD